MLVRNWQIGKWAIWLLRSEIDDMLIIFTVSFIQERNKNVGIFSRSCCVIKFFWVTQGNVNREKVVSKK